jgi:hypothetical protein
MEELKMLEGLLDDSPQHNSIRALLCPIVAGRKSAGKSPNYEERITG